MLRTELLRLLNDHEAWSEAELRAMRSDGSWYKGSAVCRRGHVETAYIDPRKADRAIPENCPTCGASVLTACQSLRTPHPR
jgi:hypothetical protein